MDSMTMQKPAYGGTSQEKKKKGISGSTIKIIAVVTMLIDHVAAAIFTRMILSGDYYSVIWSGNMEQIAAWLSRNALLYYGTQLMRLIGRLGFPIFCFLLVEGFQKTRNVKKYAFRLALFCLISEIPFDLAFSGSFVNWAYQNVYFTLLIGLLVLWAIDFLSKKDFSKVLQAVAAVAGFGLAVFYMECGVRDYVLSVLSGFRGVVGSVGGADIQTATIIGVIIAVIAILVVVLIFCVGRKTVTIGKLGSYALVLFAGMLLADVLRTDYSGMGVLTIAMMYAFRKNKVLSMLAGCITLNVMSLSEITAFFALIPIALYNGERGLKMKYFFYAFYPVHLLLIWLVALAMGMGWIPAV